MNKRTFEEWFSTFRDTLDSYEDYRIDYRKAQSKISSFKVEIYILNSLICSENIEQDFEELVAEYPKCLNAVQIILDIYGVNYDFAAPNQSIEQYKYFMRETGLFDMLQNHIISNLYDYVTGVEVGLDSNGRKNRGGHQMERLVERFLRESGVNYRKEMYLADLEETFGLDLSAISAEGTSTKRFDFVVKTANKVFGIETNFYTGGGSKLNETARSYKMIAEESKNIDGFTFVWITDGKGWKSARKNLKETFLVLDTLYNIKDLEDGIFTELFNE